MQKKHSAWKKAQKALQRIKKKQATEKKHKKALAMIPVYLNSHLQ